MAAPTQVTWTDHQDNTLRHLRHDRASWETIANAIGRPVSTCMDRCRLIGARPPLVISIVAEDISNDRRPLPSGHPMTWGLLTRGTVLEGVQYAR